MLKGGFKAHFFLSITTLIGGINYSVSKMVMPQFFQPSAIILIRGFFAIMFFWIFHLLFIKEKITDKKDFVSLLICALFGITANQLLFYEGLNLTTPINASLLQCAVPIFVLILSAWMAKERITTLKILGILLGACGAILLLLQSSKTNVQGAQMGDIMVLFNAISYAIFLVLVQPLTHKYDPLTVVKWVFLFGTILNLPFGYKQLIEINWYLLPTQAILSLVFIVIFATIINYYLNIGVLRYVPTSVAGIYIYLQPVIASIVAIYLGKDYFNLEKLLYSMMILSGVYMVSLKQKAQS